MQTHNDLSVHNHPAHTQRAAKHALWCCKTAVSNNPPRIAVAAPPPCLSPITHLHSLLPVKYSSPVGQRGMAPATQHAATCCCAATVQQVQQGATQLRAAVSTCSLATVMPAHKYECSRRAAHIDTNNLCVRRGQQSVTLVNHSCQRWQVHDCRNIRTRAHLSL